MTDDITVVDGYGTCPNCGDQYQFWVEVSELGLSEIELGELSPTSRRLTLDSLCIDREESYSSIYIHGTSA